MSERCRDKFRLPDWPLVFECTRFKGHSGGHNYNDENHEGVAFWIQWGDPTRITLRRTVPSDSEDES